MELLGLIVVALATMILIALERDRIKAFLRLILSVATGAVAIVPLRSFLGGIILPASQFMAAQMAHGEPETGEQTEPQNTPPAPVAARRPGGFHLSRFLVALAFSAATVVFFACEFQFNKPTFEALGLVVAAPAATSAAAPAQPAGSPEASPNTMAEASTLALIAALIVWGIVLLDLYRFTHFLPAPPESARPLLRAVAWTCLVGGVATALVMGAWRGQQLAAPDASTPAQVTAQDAGGLTTGSGTSLSSVATASPSVKNAAPYGPAGFDAFARVFLCAALPTLVLLSGIVSFTGVIWLLRYLALFLVGLLLVVPAVLFFLVLPLWDNLAGHILQACEAAIEWLGDMGNRLFHTLWPPLRELRDALHLRVAIAARDWTRREKSPRDKRKPDNREEQVAPEVGTPAPERELVLARSAAGSGEPGRNGHHAAWDHSEREARAGAAVADPAEDAAAEYDLHDLNWGWPEPPAAGTER